MIWIFFPKIVLCLTEAIICPYIVFSAKQSQNSGVKMQYYFVILKRIFTESHGRYCITLYISYMHFIVMIYASDKVIRRDKYKATLQERTLSNFLKILKLKLQDFKKIGDKYSLCLYHTQLEM